MIVKVEEGGSKGEILITGKRQKGSSSSTYYITTDVASGKWSSFTSTRCKFLFTGLENNKRYYIRYSINGVRNQMMMSETVAYTAQ